jgi:hypothetical protein
MCGDKTNRYDLQEAIRQQNPHFHASADIAAPDGDVLLMTSHGINMADQKFAQEVPKMATLEGYKIGLN